MTNKENIIGKKFQILSILDTVIHEFVIKFAKIRKTESKTFEDGSTYPASEHLLVSEDGSGWFRVYGGKQDRII